VSELLPGPEVPKANQEPLLEVDALGHQTDLWALKAMFAVFAAYHTGWIERYPYESGIEKRN
jgi:hypothetical protein